MIYDMILNQIEDELNKKNKKEVLQKIVNILYDNFSYYNWVGIYIVNDNNLILGPWNGPDATEHTKIPIGDGICGSAAQTGKTEIIDDVKSDERYLSCFISTKSEIVIPIKKDDRVVGEIDIDSDQKQAFKEEDRIFLEKIAKIISNNFDLQKDLNINK